MGDRLCHTCLILSCSSKVPKACAIGEKGNCNYKPRNHYDVASEVLNMQLIEDHHDLLCSRLFNSMRDVTHKLAELLPPLYSSHHDHFIILYCVQL